MLYRKSVIALTSQFRKAAVLEYLRLEVVVIEAKSAEQDF
jgi:hypothetical protein